MAFPSVLNTFSRPTTTDRLNNPSHSALHNTVSSALGQVEAVIGVDGANSVVGTMMYDLRSPASGGGGHVQSANKGGTGQTVFNKGDILVAQSSSVIAKVTIGTSDQILTVDPGQGAGVKWANPTAVNIQSFLSTGTWNKPSLLTTSSKVLVELWGGGGAGGSGVNSSIQTGGGGGGAYVEGWFNASVLGSTEIVIVGAGGAGVTGTTVGNPGAVTVFGSASLLSAFGGGGGGRGASGGGGGGGGIFSAGSNGAATAGGAAGSFGYESSVFATGGGAGGSNAQDALNSSGGGGGERVGGNTIYGGAGGGGAGGGSGSHAGGVSKLSGSGGASSETTNAVAGGFPSGGGGAVRHDTSSFLSGAGGNGKVVVTSFA